MRAALCVAASSLSSVGTSVRNFPVANRGVVVGLLIAGSGLSAALVTLLYFQYFATNADVAGFLLMLAILIGVVGTFLGVLFFHFIVVLCNIGNRVVV